MKIPTRRVIEVELATYNANSLNAYAFSPVGLGWHPIVFIIHWSSQEWVRFCLNERMLFGRTDFYLWLLYKDSTATPPPHKSPFLNAVLLGPLWHAVVCLKWTLPVPLRGYNKQYHFYPSQEQAPPLPPPRLPSLRAQQHSLESSSVQPPATSFSMVLHSVLKTPPSLRHQSISRAGSEGSLS